MVRSRLILNKNYLRHLGNICKLPGLALGNSAVGLDWDLRIWLFPSPLDVSSLQANVKNTALSTRKSEWGLPLWAWGAGVALTGKGHEAGNVLYLDPGRAYPGVHICEHLSSIQK